ncbi:hypothetical protein [Microlunatus antarcticus]|uniref:Uncharacterized protein n=1 Tax=Microlunatus antarcticus TaxID=53388 RepID=A0A7W5P630_9ACTN|nr:hypothetical protein [Microlunatus antarcticus]MBB3325942.1 hypothetical protein [Microlunatus antarcticus]
MPTETPRRVDPRVPLAVVGLVLLAAMAFLLLHGPRFETTAAFDDESVAVSCGSVLTVGWPTDHSSLSSENSRSYGDHIRSGKTDFAGRDGIARDCSERRDTYLGFLAVLAVPTSVCLSALLRPGRRSTGQTTSV